MRMLKDYRLMGLSLIILTFLFCALFTAGCLDSMTPKKQLSMMYGTYNSQYTQYMTATGYSLNEEGEWKKTFFPAYTDEEKRILRKKKEILAQMYPLVKVYDSMVVGETPFSSVTETELLNLIDQLTALGGV